MLLLPKAFNPNFLHSEIKSLSDAILSIMFNLTASGPVILLAKITDSRRASGDSLRL